MSGSSAPGFPATEEGAAFFRAYDAVLSKWPVEVRSEPVPSPFGTTWVNMCGSVEGPPVILIPGQRATSTVWFNNVVELSRRHRVFAIDIIGDAGRSVAAADTPVRSRDDLLAWLDGIIDHFKLDTPAVVAHSYGAMIAVAYALAHPERLNKLACWTRTRSLPACERPICFTRFPCWFVQPASANATSSPGRLQASHSTKTGSNSSRGAWRTSRREKPSFPNGPRPRRCRR